MTDMISHSSFSRLNTPFVKRLCEKIRAEGMKSIYYYCGDPAGRWDDLFATGCDALSLEEGKKGWNVDIAEVVKRAEGRCAVLGNLDAMNLLERGTEPDLTRELSRQIAAGRRNNNRFIMSTGSPVTPGTSMSRVRRYCDLVRKLGS
jgi:uroporphyrinogen-III decarboxylase